MVFNEVLASPGTLTNSDGSVSDWVELYNRSDTPVDLSGWGVSDDRGMPMKYTIAAGVILDPGAFYFLDETVLGFNHGQGNPP